MNIAPSTVTCACGRFSMAATPGTTLTNLRCPFCPPDKPRPKLRLA